MKRSVIAILLIASFSIFALIIPHVIAKAVSPMVVISAVVMFAIYVILSFEIVHRTSISLFGALTLVSFGIIFETIHPKESLDFIISVIDFNVIGLLLGMMIIIAILGETGAFNWVAVKAARISKGNLWKLMLVLSTFTGITSMFLDNVTIILLMIPITISLFRAMDVSPIPFILALVLSSNVGGAATLIGDPPNIIIGSAANIDFNLFIMNMILPAGVTFLVGLFLLRLIFKHDLRIVPNISAKFRTIEDEGLVKDKVLLQKCMIVLVGVISLFTIHGIIGIEISIIALGGAAVLLISTRLHIEKILQEVDWATLIFFAGLFVIVGILEEIGVIEFLGNFTIELTKGDPWITFIAIVWLSAIASAFIDNIPFTTTMVPVIETLNMNPNISSVFGNLEISPLWWALALGADFGGNGTLIGSSAGVVAAGIALKFGYKISFLKWIRIGFPFMLITVAVGSTVLMLMTFVMINK